MDGLLPVMLFILLPAIGTLVAALLAWRAFRDARDEAGIPAAPAGQPDRAMGQVLPLIAITATGPVFGMALFLIARMADPPLADNAFIAIGTCIGLAGLFTALGQGMIARVAARDIVRAPANFARHLVTVAQCEPGVIFAFALAFLSIQATPPPANLAMADYIMGVSSIGAVVSGLLSANVDPLQMGRRTVRSAVGMALALAGFLAAYILLGIA
jgi:F0F1-type ATP synthase membrane subunit c/vacuolar-type H+-ATPase subunit K